MLEVETRVKVKLHEPVGNPTTESANNYLGHFKGEGVVLAITHPPDKGTWYRVWFPYATKSLGRSGVFREHELEVIE